jgi:hypothetical protein
MQRATVSIPRLKKSPTPSTSFDGIVWGVCRGNRSVSSENKSRLRRRFWIDRPVQGALMIRTALYWLFGLIYFSLVMLTTELFGAGDLPLGQTFQRFAIDALNWMPMMVLLLPLVAYDTMRLSHRFVGPVYRLRVGLERLARREHDEPIKFRDGDYWFELAEPFNAVLQRINDLESELAQLKSRPSPPSPAPAPAPLLAAIENADIDQLANTCG